MKLNIRFTFIMLFMCASGCSHQIVKITSTPTGAVVTCDNQRYIGETPLYYKVDAKHGFNNKYKFCAILKGYKGQAKEFIEDEWAFDVKWVIPEEIHFDMEPVE